MTKASLRAEMIRLRRNTPAAVRAVASARLCERLAVREPKGPVAVYLASADELDLTSFIDRCVSQGILVAAPRWTGTTYEMAELNGCWPHGCAVGPHAIREPSRAAATLAPAKIATWIVPGLAFTHSGQRLGYGGGWYDRLLAQSATDAVTIGVGYDFQVVPTLPVEEHDRALHAIESISTSGTWKTSGEKSK